jgi:hypothetical protein
MNNRQQIGGAMPLKETKLRDNPMSTYVRPDIKRRVQKLAEIDPRWSISRIIEESIERCLPALEKELRGKA